METKDSFLEIGRNGIFGPNVSANDDITEIRLTEGSDIETSLALFNKVEDYGVSVPLNLYKVVTLMSASYPIASFA